MEISIAARGWQGAEWDGYYPDDLPADWRLDYYANEFFAVLVPHAAWRSAHDEALLEWQEQVSDDFRFFYEVDGAGEDEVARLQQLLKDDDFSAHWGGIVTASSPCSQSPFEGESVNVLNLSEPMALRPLREAMESAIKAAGSRLLVVVEPEAASTMRSARDLAQLLGGG